MSQKKYQKHFRFPFLYAFDRRGFNFKLLRLEISQN